MDKPTKYPTANNFPNDRRNSLRYLITGRARFQWESADGRWHDAVGSTHDIGKAGVFVESECVPPVSSALKLIVVLPTGRETDPNLCLSGSGYVRRVVQGPGQRTGFGASAAFNVKVPDRPLRSH